MKKLSKKGLVHIYTGDGKGKTTAAFGLALRAAGAGFRVFIYQFLKGPACCEKSIFRGLKNIKFEYCGSDSFIKGEPTGKDIAVAQKGLRQISQHIKSCKYDLVILDEINVALSIGLVDIADVVVLIKGKPKSVEIVMTGRRCPKSLYKHADLVTEMKNVKHPYDMGIPARKGIEF